MCRFKELFHLSLKPRSDRRQGNVLPENEVGVLVPNHGWLVDRIVAGLKRGGPE